MARIADAARANPNSLYSHLGSKEALFDAAVRRALGDLGAAVPVTPEDLPGFAVRSLDWLLANPHAIRLHMWRVLESPSSGPDDTALYRDLVQRMDAVRTSSDALPSADLLVLVVAMVLNWVLSSPDLLAADGRAPTDPARVADFRHSLALAVERLEQTRVCARPQ